MNLLFLSPSGGELMFIMVAVLMLFGSKKIPELARSLGKGIREIKNATSDIQNEVTKDMSSSVRDFKKMKEDVKDSINITKNDNS
ncbi:MAG: sec-independent protein translocase protein TatA [Glaciecola sp.]|jgi:sec-independent protein translocase protein TatA